MFDVPHGASLRSYRCMLERAEADARRLDNLLIDLDGCAEINRAAFEERERAHRLVYVVSRLIILWHNDVYERAHNRVRSRR